MKIQLNSLQLGAVISLVVLAALGVGGYLWLSSEIEDATALVNKRVGERAKLLARQVTPSQTNLATLKTNAQVLESSLAVLEEVLVRSAEPLATVQERNAVLFKQDLSEAVKRLNEKATAQGVKVPNGFYYGFARYLNQNPEDRQTVFLGQQLLAIRTVTSALFEAGIQRLEVVRRTMDELPAPVRNAGRGGTEAEALKGSADPVAGGLYRVLPLEFELVTKPKALREAMNALQQAPLFLVVRSVQVTSRQPNAMRLSDLARTAGGGGVPGGERPPVPAMGFEEVQVRLRVDAVQWLGSEGVAAVQAAAAAKPGAPVQR